MKASAIRKMDESAIRSELKGMYSDLYKTQGDLRFGKENDVKKGLKIKRNIARMLTVLQELSYKR